jgi:hypothetical protein
MVSSSHSSTRPSSSSLLNGNISEVGNGGHTFFWIDRWLQGQTIANLAPQLYAAISQARKRKRTVHETLVNRAWILDIQRTLTIGIIVEFIQLWDILYDFQLQPEVEDSHI